MERRSYRPPQEEKQAVETPAATPAPPVVATPESPTDRGEGKSKFVNITGLFRTKSGKADTIFLTEQMCDMLYAVQPGDVLGVSENAKNGRLQLWYIPKEEG
jgi:hypothetical protein